jgi:mRNA-degrading endonuclease toxin of MazEF toxin-antitoxin module
MFSNTARSHEFGKAHDWVVIFRDDAKDHGQWTVITYLLNRYRVELRVFLRWLRWRRLATGVPIVD